MKVTVTTLLEGGPPPTADEVAAIVVAIAMQARSAAEPPGPKPVSRFRLDGRRYEPYDREIP